MAAKNENPPQSLAKGVDKELTCAICISRLVHPKVLPCLHTYCKECLVKLVEKSRDKENVTCPQCQGTHPLPANGIDGFQTHFTINNLLELLHVYDKMAGYDVPVISCESGVDDSPAVARCLTCEEYLCGTCYTFHTKQKRTRDHTILSLEEIKASGQKKGVQSIRKKQHCVEHKDEVLKLFCKTCQTVICRDCVLITHRDHEYAFISEVRQETQKKLEKLVDTIKEKEKETQTHVKHVEKIRQTNLESLDVTEKEIEEAFKEIVAALEVHKAKLLAKVHNIHQTSSKQIEAEADSATLALVRLSDSVHFIHQLLENGDDVEVMSMSQQAEQTLQGLTKITWEVDKIKTPEPIILTDPKMKQTIDTFVSVAHQPEDIAIDLEVLPNEAHALDEFTFKVRIQSEDKWKGCTKWKFDPTVKVTHGKEEIPVKCGKTEHFMRTFFCTPKEAGKYTINVSYGFKTEKIHTIEVMSPVMRVGRKVVRGPDWKWHDQDGGEGGVGTVVEFIEHISYGVHVVWDHDKSKNYYRWGGAEGKHDLKIVG